jgi:peroxiredoxin Q/BCP
MIAPDFSLPDQNGTIHALSDHPTAWRVVYFYPKDDTPGCTTEACNFRDNIKKFAEQNIVLYGVSKDSVKSHVQFAKKYSLNFPLLSDPSGKTIEAYGAQRPATAKEPQVYETTRKTVVVNPTGDIVKTYEDMNLETHAEEILEDIAALSA